MTTVGADCATPAEHAESATVHALLNCYLRETGAFEVVDAGESDAAAAHGDAPNGVAVCPLDEQGVTLFAPLRYASPTGRHLFDLPAYSKPTGGEETPLDAPTLAALLCRELSLGDGGGAGGEGSGDAPELLRRVLLSQRNVERFVAARGDDAERLYGFDTTFRDAEQSLLYGHLLHPTPKSRQGIPAHEQPTYAPELRGSFRLHYFRADPSVVAQGSARRESAVDWVKRELRSDDAVDEAAIEAYVDGEDALVPVHPWQADYLRGQGHVREATELGLVADVGPLGREFHPTTSVRTVYHPDASFMHKGSLAVRITNSERTHTRAELERGVAVAELLDSGLGDDLRSRYPDFRVVRDPAYLTLDLGDGAVSGFEVVLRENPFSGDDARNATPVVALCQDGVDGPSRLARIVETLAEREGRSTEAVSRDWLRRYLDVTLRPALWFYLARGVGVEAHQQNTVVALDGGYPDAGYYRDNQGYYFPESTYPAVDDRCPGVGERADTICPDAVADERLRYYLFFNNVFGVVNALGVGGVADERALLAVVRETLRDLQAFDRPSSSLLDDLLTERRLPCKANLLTRFRDMDELVGSLDDQSVYTEVPNPLVTELDAPSNR